MKKIPLFLMVVFLFGSCKSFRSRFAAPITWVPKHSYELKTAGPLGAVLGEQIPLDFIVKFDTAWNKNNKPAPLDHWEDYSVEEDVVDFLVKAIEVEGGKGAFFLRRVVNGKEEIGEPFSTGIKIKHGTTKLFYVPDQASCCHAHTISISSTILTRDYDREAGPPVTCCLNLSEPKYTLATNMGATIAYVEDKQTPFTICVASDNPLAAKQSYRLSSWSIQNGKGALFVKTKSSSKPVYHGMPIHFGSNELFYVPEKGHDGEHTIHLEIGNSKGNETQSTSLAIPVEDHRIEAFTAILSKNVENEPILPFKNCDLKLVIEPAQNSGKKLSYHVQSIKMESGKLLMDTKTVIDGTPLKVGSNHLVLNPEGKQGHLGLSITVVNSKGDEAEVSFSQPMIVSDPAFNVQSCIANDSINLKVHSPNHSSSDQWMIADFRLTGGIDGKLLKPTGETVDKHSALQVGDNYFSFQLIHLDRFMERVDGAPKLDFDITYPDGTVRATKSIDLSSFLVSAVDNKIVALEVNASTLWHPMVEDYKVNPEHILKDLEDLSGKWQSKHAHLTKILSYMKHATIASTQANAALVRLQALEDATKENIKSRVVTTRLLHEWYKDVTVASENKSPDGRQEATRRLEDDVRGFMATNQQAYQNIVGLEDVIPALEALLQNIDHLRPETTRIEDQIQAEKDLLRAELDDHSNRINIEQSERESDVRSLNDHINRESSARRSAITSLENDIRKLYKRKAELGTRIDGHDGDLSKLNALMNELSSVNANLRTQCASLQSQLNAERSRSNDFGRYIGDLMSDSYRGNNTTSKWWSSNKDGVNNTTKWWNRNSNK